MGLVREIDLREKQQMATQANVFLYGPGGPGVRVMELMAAVRSQLTGELDHLVEEQTLYYDMCKMRDAFLGYCAFADQLQQDANPTTA